MFDLGEFSFESVRVVVVVCGVCVFALCFSASLNLLILYLCNGISVYRNNFVFVVCLSSFKVLI